MPDKNLPKILLDAIHNLPNSDGGWWHVSGEETFQSIAAELLDHGVPVDTIQRILEFAYGAVAEEFGD